jgi:hypothetical protein
MALACDMIVASEGRAEEAEAPQQGSGSGAQRHITWRTARALPPGDAWDVETYAGPRPLLPERWAGQNRRRQPICLAANSVARPRATAHMPADRFI